MQLNPLDDFRAEDSTLEFRNLGAEHDLADVQAYEYEWSAFDNATSRLTPLGEKGESMNANVPMPTVSKAEAGHLMVRIRTRSREEPNWGKAVDVYLRNENGRSVVGIEREIPEPEKSVGDAER